MGVFDNFRKAFSSTPQMETKEAPRIYMQQSSPFHNRTDNFKSYATDGYMHNAIVYRCVNEIANGAASIKFKVFQGDIELEQHLCLVGRTLCRLETNIFKLFIRFYCFQETVTPFHLKLVVFQRNCICCVLIALR